MIEPLFKYLNFRKVADYRGVSVSTLYNDIRAGSFPAGERLGANMVRWRSDVVAAWLEEQSRKAQVPDEAAINKAKERVRLATDGRHRKAEERAAAAAAE